MNILNVIKKEFKDFIYSHKSVLTVIIEIIGVKFLLHIAKHDDYTIFLHFWLITTALQQFIYDSFLTDIKEKGILFYLNLKIPFSVYFLPKLIICIVLEIIMVLFEIKNIIRTTDFLTFSSVFIQCLIAVPIMFISSIFVKLNETGGLVITSLLMAIILFSIRLLPSPVLILLSSILLFLFCCFLAYKTFKSLLYRKQI